jgi:hypothetical protein
MMSEPGFIGLNDLRMHGCKSGKVRFETEEEALHALKMIARKPRKRVPVRMYYCPFCTGIHLTSRDGHNGKIREIKMSKEFEKYISQ